MTEGSDQEFPSTEGPALEGSGTPPPSPPAGLAIPGGPPEGDPRTSDWFLRLLAPAYDAQGWLKFLGFVLILMGGLQALTIIGVLWAWLFIWVGVLLWQAGDRAVQAAQMRDPRMLEQYLLKVKTVVVVGGVVTAIMVLVTVLGLLMFLALGGLAAVLGGAGGFFDQIIY